MKKLKSLKMQIEGILIIFIAIIGISTPLQGSLEDKTAFKELRLSLKEFMQNRFYPEMLSLKETLDSKLTKQDLEELNELRSELRKLKMEMRKEKKSRFQKMKKCLTE